MSPRANTDSTITPRPAPKGRYILKGSCTCKHEDWQHSMGGGCVVTVAGGDWCPCKAHWGER